MMASVMKNPAEVVRGVVQGLPVCGVDQPGVSEGGVEHRAQGAVADRAVLGLETALEQDRGRRLPCAFVAVVGRDERYCAGGLADPADDGGQHICELG